MVGDFGAGLLSVAAWQRPLEALVANERQLGWALNPLDDDDARTAPGAAVDAAALRVQSGCPVRVQQSIRFQNPIVPVYQAP